MPKEKQDDDLVLLPHSGAAARTGSSFKDYAGMMWRVFPFVHKKGWTPFSFNTVNIGTDGLPHYRRDQHLRATAAMVAVMMFTAMTAVYKLNFQHSHDAESKFYQGLDTFGHQVAAALTLGIISVAVGAVSAAIHKISDKARGVHDHSEYSVSVQSGGVGEGVEGERTEMDERDNLLGKDADKNLIFKVTRFDPIRLVHPRTPGKTFVWMTLLAAAGFAVGCGIDKDFFDKIANSEVGHVGGIVALAAATAVATAGVATLFHYAGGKATDRCLGEANSSSVSGATSEAVFSQP